MLRFFSGLADRIFALVGALVIAQMPLFMQQYEQQLVGHVAELKIQVDAMRKVAGGRGIEAYIKKFAANPDADYSSQGEIMQSMLIRWGDLNHALDTLADANVWTKPIIFLKTMNVDIAHSTLQHYDFGIPLTIEGAVYAFIGLLLGMGLFRFLTSTFKKIQSERWSGCDHPPL